MMVSKYTKTKVTHTGIKKLSLALLAETVESRHKAKKLTQAQLSKLTGINRSLLSRLESRDFTPSIEKLKALAEVLDFEPVDRYIEQKGTRIPKQL